MCVYSNCGDYWRDRTVPEKWPWVPQNPDVWPEPSVDPSTDPFEIYKKVKEAVAPELPITREEFNELKKAVEEIHKLLKAAKKYDEEMGEPNCEKEEKIELIKKMAKMVGVDISDVLENDCECEHGKG